MTQSHTTGSDEQMSALIAAAEARAELYEGDDRQDIKTDVMNAFYAGAEYQRTHQSPAAEAVVPQFVGRVFVDQLTGQRQIVPGGEIANVPDMARVYVLPNQPAAIDATLVGEVGKVVGLIEFHGQAIVATESGVFRIVNDKLIPIPVAAPEASPSQPAAIEPVAAQAMTDADLELAWAAMFPNDNNSRHNALIFARALLASQPSQPATGAQGDAFERWAKQHPVLLDHFGQVSTSKYECRIAYDAWQAALESAQPIEQKPVAWLAEYWNPPTLAGEENWTTITTQLDPTGSDGFRNVRPLYTAPQQSTAIDVRDAALLADALKNVLAIIENQQDDDVMRSPEVIGAENVLFAYKRKSSPPATEAGEQQ
jgi:hypothetical protein